MMMMASKIVVYVDDSNIWVSGKKMAGQQRGLRDNDPRWRYDLHRLLRVAVGDVEEQAVRVNVYGSRHRQDGGASDAMLNSLAGYRVNVRVFDRSARGWEKEVDQALSVDLVADATRLDAAVEFGLDGAAERKANTLFVVLSGDLDMRPAIQQVLSYGMRVRVCSFQESLAVEYRQLATGSHLFELMLLDSHVGDFGFTNFRSTNRVFDSAHALTIRLPEPGSVGDNADEQEDAVQQCCRRLLATQALFFFSRPAAADLLHVEFPDLPLHRALDKARSVLGCSAAVSPYGSPSSDAETDDSPAPPSSWPSSSSASSSASASSSQNVFRNLSVHDCDTEDEEDADSDSDSDGNYRGGVDLSAATATDDTTTTADNTTTSPSSADDEDGNEGFQSVRSRRQTAKQREQRLRRRQSQCRNGIHCPAALECTMIHTAEEQRLFRKLPSIQFANWKTQLCSKTSTRHCHADCPFAHAPADSWCVRCRVFGHLRAACLH